MCLPSPPKSNNIVLMDKALKATLRKMGNSQGVLIPKAVLELLGLPEALEMTIEGDALVLRKPAPVEESNPDARDARRFRTLCVLLQKAYDGEATDSAELSVLCSMKSGWKSERTVGAELIWRDARDEPLDLGAALDKLEATLRSNEENTV